MCARQTPWIVCSLALLLFAAGNAAAANGEVTLVATSTSGDYGSGIESDTEWLTLRYAVGNELQFRADVSMIRADSLSSGVAYTGLGPVARGGNGNGPGGTQPPAGASIVEESSSIGLGDVRLAVSRRVLGGGARLYRFDASAEVKLPTADEAEHLGTGEWDYRLGLASEYRFWSSTLFGGLGWNRLGDTPDVELDDILDAYVGIDSEPFARDALVATAWVEGWQAAIDTTDSRVAVGAGLRTTGRVRWRLQARAGLTDSAEDLAVIAGISFGVSPVGPGVSGHQR